MIRGGGGGGGGLSGWGGAEDTAHSYTSAQAQTRADVTASNRCSLTETETGGKGDKPMHLPFKT